jgi:hypothetical protein
LAEVSGTPERRNSGTPELRNSGTPELQKRFRPAEAGLGCRAFRLTGPGPAASGQERLKKYCFNGKQACFLNRTWEIGREIQISGETERQLDNWIMGQLDNGINEIFFLTGGLFRFSISDGPKGPDSII